MSEIALTALTERLQAVKKLLTQEFSREEEKILSCLCALGEEEMIDSYRAQGNLEFVIEALMPAHRFYASMGGLPGYFVKLLSLLHEEERECDPVSYTPPPSFPITCRHDELKEWVSQGLAALPQLVEIYPVGGAADRLKLQDGKTGEALPAACFEFCGKTLLEWLIRDLQGREYLYFKRYGKEITTPVALMTSQEKDNHARLLALFEEKGWFSRPRTSFFLFCQPLVPSIHHDGSLAFTDAGLPLMKPGGHGVIWKLMEQEGVFEWMHAQGRSKAVVRQINNPVAGMGCLLLGFYGLGVLKQKLFGFVSVPRLPNAAEGVNALALRNGRLSLSNAEYCGATCAELDDPAYLANTNILFADVAALEQAVVAHPFPGLLVNWKKVPVQNEEKEIARLESTMQNIAEADVFSMPAQDDLGQLPAFLAVGKRHRTLSAIKRAWNGNQLLETPEGCLFDLLLNAKHLLEKCGFEVPEVVQESYIQQGPPFLYFAHPALGPLNSIVKQKLRGGSLAKGSELELEIAELDIENLQLQGSLRILAHQVMGSQCGRASLKNVTVENLGLRPSELSDMARGRITRQEECLIEIEGNGEFEAQDVRFLGGQHIRVKSGTRLIAEQRGNAVHFREEKISGSTWSWHYSQDESGEFHLKK